MIIMISSSKLDIYIYIEREGDSGLPRVLLEHDIDIEGWNSHAHREFPGEFESGNLSRNDMPNLPTSIVPTNIA